MSQIHQIYKIKSSPEKVWKALTDSKEINDWGGGPAVMDDKVGTEFKFWGGDIFGKNKKVEPQKLLVQEWYGNKDWKSPSIVEFKISFDKNITTVELNHNGLPETEIAEFASGWKDFYMGPLKEYLEAEE